MSCGPLCGCPAGRHPVLIGDVLPDVIAALLEREGKGGESPLCADDSGASLWENRSGPEGALTPESPALDQPSCVRGSASRGL